jgi:hypothetical protein
MGFNNGRVVENFQPIFPVRTGEVLQSFQQNLPIIPEGKTIRLYSNLNEDHQIC